MLRDIAEARRPQAPASRGHDEVAEMSRWFNVFVGKLHDIISQIRASSDTVALAAPRAVVGVVRHLGLSAGAGVEPQRQPPVSRR
ncbi:MAG: methyl-accepting chemotaxis protein [Planctomycetes bacterium]|nr:methyl-accepting chemotaxis protein [Planctomycetota bacterium]